MMTPEEMVAIAKATGDALREAVAEATKPLLERIAQLEAKQLERPLPVPAEKGDPGDRGDPGERGPPGENGDPGERGEPGPSGAPGQDGAPGERGPVGERGATGEAIKGDTGEPGAPGETGAVGERGPAGERGEPGLAGEKGAPGESIRGERGEAGAPGQRGADGRSFTVEEVRALVLEVFTLEQAKWALEWERRAHDLVQRFLDRIPVPKDGRDGVDGKNGRDCIDIATLAAELGEDLRTLTWRVKAGDQTVEASVVLPHPVHVGVFRPEMKYVRGDEVTYRGATWIALRETTDTTPGTDTINWRLIVKGGRDGKDGAKGERGERGRDSPGFEALSSR